MHHGPDFDNFAAQFEIFRRSLNLTLLLLIHAAGGGHGDG
jgi:hypothetical protein